MNNHDRELDNELAAFTDRLLGGDQSGSEPDSDDLVRVVAQLHHMLATEQPGDTAIRQHMRQRLAQEWERHYPARRQGVFRFRHHRLAYLAALAATLVIALGAVALFAASRDQDTALQGTASGSVSNVIIAGAVLVGLTLLIIALLWQRRRS